MAWAAAMTTRKAANGWNLNGQRVGPRMLGPNVPTQTIAAVTRSTRTVRRTVCDVTTQYAARGRNQAMYVIGSNMNPCPAKPSTYGWLNGDHEKKTASRWCVRNPSLNRPWGARAAQSANSCALTQVGAVSSAVARHAVA